MGLGIYLDESPVVDRMHHAHTNTGNASTHQQPRQEAGGKRRREYEQENVRSDIGGAQQNRLNDHCLVCIAGLVIVEKVLVYPLF